MPLRANKSPQRRWLYAIHFVLLGNHINYTIVLARRQSGVSTRLCELRGTEESELYQTSSTNY